MVYFGAICIYVDDGETFQITKGDWIRLANVCAPDSGEEGYAEAKNMLSNLILNKEIAYELVGTSYNRIVAEVWVEGINVNEYMHRKGYTCP